MHLPKVITINKTYSKPKYEQIVEKIISCIDNGIIGRGQQLPSIAALASEQQLAKATVVKGYDILCERGIIIAQPGKGFYVSNTSVKANLNIFLLFDTFNHYKEILYKSFRQLLPEDAQCSIFFHHYNLSVFENIISDSIGKYTHYVIVPHFKKNFGGILNRIPAEKLFVLDQQVKQLKRGTSSIYQPFEKDVFNGLMEAKELLKKYRTLHLILGNPYFQYIPKEIIAGFNAFTNQTKIKYTVQTALNEDKINKGDAYFLFSDSDTIQFIKYIEAKKYKLGSDIGLLSYDDTPMKEILMGGISVISTDFKNMGQKAAEAILNKQIVQIENPGGFIKRKSL